MITTHNLDFEVAPYPENIDPDYDWMRFKIGTCTGLWSASEYSYNILAIDNDKPGNGHLKDVFEWFEASCKRDKKKLIVMAIVNAKFKEHLISKRGFMDCGEDAEKNFV